VVWVPPPYHTEGEGAAALSSLNQPVLGHPPRQSRGRYSTPLIADPLDGKVGVTLFEYLAAGFVLILSFAVMRGMSGVPYALRPAARHWVHFAYVSITLANCLITFWMFWFTRDVEWTFFRFLVALLVPVLLYVQVSLIVPQDPSTVSSWETHFLGVRIPYFATGAATFMMIAVSHQTLLGVPALHPIEWPVYTTAAIYALGVTSPAARLHSALALANSCITAVGVVAILSQKDPLSSFI